MRVIILKSSKNSLFSLSASSASSALSQLPSAILAIRCAASASIPLFCINASSIFSVSMRCMTNSCVRLLIVSSKAAGFSLTNRKTVCEGGSSMSLSNLLAVASFILSAIQIMATLNPPWLDLRESLCVSSSASLTVMMACCDSVLMASSHCSIVK